MEQVQTAARVLAFWFEPRSEALWFEQDPVFDREIAVQFAHTTEAGAAGQLEPWRDSPAGALALVIALDQFPRNMYRGSARAFAHDERALTIAAAAIERGFDRQMSLRHQLFFYLPFEHSEVLAVQERSLELFQRWADDHSGAGRADADDQMLYVRRHHEIIRRFGRFPHRNSLLGRESTPEEVAFLDEPLSSF